MTAATHDGEPHLGGLAGRLNWLRAGVLGANDGIVSVAAIVVGVGGATSTLAPIVTAGTAALIGGAVSMALGEYVSVSSQRDSQRALIEKERRELRDDPDAEFDELVELHERKGLSASTARLVASELTRKDALAAHLEIELGIDADDVVSPWAAAGASALAFLIGGAIPFAAMFAPAPARIVVVFAAVVIALAVTGMISARLGRSGALRATLRLVVGGLVALGATYLIGSLLGSTGVV